MPRVIILMFLVLASPAYAQDDFLPIQSVNPDSQMVHLPETNIHIKFKSINLAAAPADLVRATLGDDVFYGIFIDPKNINRGFVYKNVDVSKLPFWIFASYQDDASKCAYYLVDGFYPKQIYQSFNEYQRLNEAVPLEQYFSAKVMRNCDGKWEQVSLEGYIGGLFDSDHTSPQTKKVGEEIVTGLAHSLVENLKKLFGGTEALQKKLDSDSSHSFFHADPVLARALEKDGFKK